MTKERLAYIVSCLMKNLPEAIPGQFASELVIEVFRLNGLLEEITDGLRRLRKSVESMGVVGR